MFLRAIYQSSPATISDGKYGMLQIDDAGNLKVALTGSSTITSLPQGSAIYSGNKNVTTAGTQLALATTQAVKGVVIKAKAANTGVIYVGASDVSSTTGFALAAGESITLDIDDLATVYIDSSVNGEGVTYIATN